MVVTNNKFDAADDDMQFPLSVTMKHIPFHFSLSKTAQISTESIADFDYRICLSDFPMMAVKRPARERTSISNNETVVEKRPVLDGAKEKFVDAAIMEKNQR